jgi:hypothetical protein
MDRGFTVFDLHRHSESMIEMKRMTMILKMLLLFFVHLESKCSKGDSSISTRFRHGELYAA